MPMCQLDRSLFVSHDTTINQTPSAISEGSATPKGTSIPKGTLTPEGTPSPEGPSSPEGLVGQGNEEEDGQEGMSNPESTSAWQAAFEEWMAEHDLSLDHNSFVVKPADAGHSQEAWLVHTAAALEGRAHQILAKVRCIAVRIMLPGYSGMASDPVSICVICSVSMSGKGVHIAVSVTLAGYSQSE